MVLPFNGNLLMYLPGRNQNFRVNSCGCLFLRQTAGYWSLKVTVVCGCTTLPADDLCHRFWRVIRRKLIIGMRGRYTRKTPLLSPLVRKILPAVRLYGRPETAGQDTFSGWAAKQVQLSLKPNTPDSS